MASTPWGHLPGCPLMVASAGHSCPLLPAGDAEQPADGDAGDAYHVRRDAGHQGERAGGAPSPSRAVRPSCSSYGILRQ